MIHRLTPLKHLCGPTMRAGTAALLCLLLVLLAVSLPREAGAITITTPDAGRGPHASYKQPTAWCARCHQAHSGTTRRFLRGYWNDPVSGDSVTAVKATEEGTCYTCHDGTGSGATLSTYNLKAQFAKKYRMPITASVNIHIGREPTNAASYSGTTMDPIRANRHVECLDCHNPHVARGANHMANAPTNAASKKLAGVWGVTIDYNGKTWDSFSPTAVTYSVVTPDVEREFQVCFKCHSGYAYGSSPPLSPSFVEGNNVDSNYTPRLQTDQSKEFNPSNPSYHPIMTAGKNSFTYGSTDYGATNFKTMILNDYSTKLTSNSRIHCSDCHRKNYDDTANLNGPHGSTQPFLLIGRWDTNINGNDPARSTSTAYGSHPILCFNCHNQSSYFTSGGATGYRGDPGNLHWFHLVDNGSSGDDNDGTWATCMNCHSGVPHGSPRFRLLVTTSDPRPYRTAKSRLQASDNLFDGRAAPTGNYGSRDQMCNNAMNGAGNCR